MTWPEVAVQGIYALFGCATMIIICAMIGGYATRLRSEDDEEDDEEESDAASSSPSCTCGDECPVHGPCVCYHGEPPAEGCPVHPPDNCSPGSRCVTCKEGGR